MHQEDRALNTKANLTSANSSETVTPQYEAIIVGTGFGGMGAAIELKRQGIKSILMFDRADDLGGTWHLNTYPGIAVDIASVSYSYSFEPNPNWSRLYAPGNELKDYANHVAKKYDLRRYMQFNTSIEKSVYNEDGKFWTVYPEGGEPVTTRILVLATGFLSQPKNPNIKGIDDFSQKIIHTARWDHDYDLNGKRVAMIGTGATAVQLIPEISDRVNTLDVYQRTPIWVLPKTNPKIPKLVQKMYEIFPFTQRATRAVSSKILETVMVTGAINYGKNTGATKRVEDFGIRFMKSQVKDRELRKKLTPDYSFGCKRPTFSNDYYKTFTKSHVDLITDSIDHIEENAIVTTDGQRREIDVLILATGFNLWEKGNFPAFDVFGKDGVELTQRWNENHYKNYEGISIPGYPNLFNLHCPYSFNGFSYFSTIESQMKHMARCLKGRDQAGALSFEATEAAQDRFIAQMESKAQHTVFNCGSCETSNSYYFNQHGEAKLLRLSSTSSAFKQATSFPFSDYIYA